MKTLNAFVLVAALSFLAGAGLMYVAPRLSWTSDMANQPSIKPQERPFSPPRESVPVEMSTTRLLKPQSASEPTFEPVEETAHTHGPDAAPRPHEKAEQGPGEPNRHAHGSSSGQPEGADHHHGTGPSHGHESNMEGHHQEENAGHHQGDHQDHRHGSGPEQSHKESSGHQHGSAHPHTDSPDHSSVETHDQPQGDHHERESSSTHRHGSSLMQPPADGKAHHQDANNGHAHGHAQGHKTAHGPELRNPIEPTTASVQRGQQMFEIYCLVCHGPEGRGGMPIAEKYPKIPRYTTELLRQVSDSHLYSMLTTGHGPMPGYAEALSAEERWHTINYLRSLEKQ